MIRPIRALTLTVSALVIALALQGCSSRAVTGVGEQQGAVASKPAGKPSGTTGKGSPKPAPPTFEPVEIYGAVRHRWARSLSEVISAKPYGMLSPMNATSHLEVARYTRSTSGFRLSEEDFSADAYRACVAARARALKVVGPDACVRVVLAGGWAVGTAEDAAGTPIACVYQAEHGAEGLGRDVVNGAVLDGSEALNALDALARR